MDTTPCEKCGAPLTPAVRFCPRCGQAVTRDGVTPQALARTRPPRRVGPQAVQCGTCGTQTVPDVAFCFECGAPVGTVAADPGGGVRMEAQSADVVPRRKLPLWTKLLIVFGVLALGGFSACVACIAWGFHSVPSTELKWALQKRERVPAGLAAQMPSDEAAFCAAVDQAAAAATKAGGVSASGAELTRLADEQHDALKNFGTHPAITGWVGVPVQTMQLNRGINLELQLPCAARVSNGKITTRLQNGTPVSEVDTFSIHEGDPLFEKALQVVLYRPALFSAVFSTGQAGDLQPVGLSQAGKIIAPNFMIDLQDVKSLPAPPPEDAGTEE